MTEELEQRLMEAKISQITIKGKILLHLIRFSVNEDCINAPYDLTQDGIGGVVGISRAHASVDLKKLLNDECVMCWKSHVLGYSSKRLVYVLTAKGRREAEILSAMLRERGIEPEILLDMQRCNPADMWKSLSEEDRDVLGKACILRTSIPRTELPPTELGSIPVDRNGMISIPAAVAKNYLTFAHPARQRSWHSWAADYWNANNDQIERLYHLTKAGRMDEAGKCVVENKDMIMFSPDVSTLKILKKITPTPEDYITVTSVAAIVAMKLGDLACARQMADRIAAVSDFRWKAIHAGIARASGDPEKAIALAQEAYKEERCTLAALVAAEAYVDMQDIDNANACLGLAIKGMAEGDDTAEVYRVFAIRARIEELRGDLEKARSMETSAEKAVSEKAPKKKKAKKPSSM